MAHRVLIEHYDRHDPRLGRLAEHDSRSRAYPITAAAPRKLADVFWPDTAPVLNQGDIGACVGFTGADVLNTTWADPLRKRVNKNKFFTNKDGLEFYKAATLADDIPGVYPPRDTGSSSLGLAKALKKLGYINAYEHAFTWNQLVAGIASQPLCMGTLWTNSMFTSGADGVIHVGPLNDNTIAGGHEWMLRGISYTRGLVLGRNHWAASWDSKTVAQKLPGEFWLSIADLRILLAHQGDAMLLKL